MGGTASALTAAVPARAAPPRREVRIPVTADDGSKQASSALTVNAGLNSLALGSAKVWVGLANSDDAGIKFDLQAIVKKNGSQVGSGQLSSVNGGGSSFNNARLNTITLALTAGPTTVSTGDTLSIEVLVRTACTRSGHNSGRARLCFNGAKIDTGKTADAGSRFDATIGTAASDYFLRTGAVLGATAGSARASVDAKAGAKCSPFTSFGTWSLEVP